VTGLPRPQDLPEFEKPPLVEVALGVQFNPPTNFKQIYAYNVWELFREQFPKVQEMEPLTPQFETFGIVHETTGLSIQSGLMPYRFWFLAENEFELLQFQQDRLLHNWRKVYPKNNAYPRFEKMAPAFCDELKKLCSYFKSVSDLWKIEINQCEITYINHIVDSQNPNELVMSDWLSIFPVMPAEIEDINIQYRRTIKVADHPKGRIYVVVRSVRGRRGERMIQLELTVRGLPEDGEIHSAMDFLWLGRREIVQEFSAITTGQAQKQWERNK
jgi:uncharacterized protein (TIGR04255 family)